MVLRPPPRQPVAKGHAMASRSVWSGFLRFSLVAVPVKAFADAWNNLGTLLVELGRPDDAIVAFGRSRPTRTTRGPTTTWPRRSRTSAAPPRRTRTGGRTSATT